MIYAFQDRVNLYLIMDYMPGGDLRFQIGRTEMFPEHVVKFFVCCILLSLKCLHENNIIHRDIKPENLIFDSKGYLRLTDMGVARIDSPKNQEDTSGTPGYMAPEVITRDQHSFPVDFFALGVIAYECMLGRVLIMRFRDPIEAITDNKSGNRCFFMKPQSNLTSSPKTGTLLQLILSTICSKGSLQPDSETTEYRR